MALAATNACAVAYDIFPLLLQCQLADGIRRNRHQSKH
jgi:hypothetical protein